MARETQGFFIGADQTFGIDSRIGLVGGYSHSHATLHALRANNGYDTYHLGAYAAHHINAFRLRGGVAYSGHDRRVQRAVLFSNFANYLSSHDAGGSAQAFAQLAYRLPDITRVAVEPLLDLAYVHAHMTNLREQGGAASLAVTDIHKAMFYTTLGAREQGLLYQTPQFKLDQRLLLGWRHAASNITPLTNMAFASGSLPFDIIGTPVARDALLINASVDCLHSTRNLRLNLSYLGQVGSGVTDHAVVARLAWQIS